MVRKSFCLIIVGLFVLVPGQLWSLGLGDIEVSSALNQPLNAQINLISARPEELDEMRVELAPADVFDRVGVPRPYFLTQLKFKPVSVTGGGTAIRVTSKDPVKEPFLTFLVEVTWPKGRLLREYTVLLDPPEFAQKVAPTVSAPESAPVEKVEARPIPEPEPEVVAEPDVQEEVIEEQVAEADEVVVEEVAAAEPEEDIDELRARMDRALGIDHSEPVIREAEIAESEPTAEELEEAVIEETSATEQTVLKPKLEPLPDWDALPEIDEEVPVVADGADYVVNKGDTLSEIANNSRTSDEMSLNQMMLAIQQANPDAFIKNNINLIKTGAVLRMPKEDDVSIVSVAEARAEVSKQNALWREYRGQVTQQLAATNVDAPDLVEEKEAASTELASEAEQVLQETQESETPVVQQELNILASDEAKETTTSPTQVAGGEEVQKLQSELQDAQKELTLSKELVQSRDKENEELKSRIEALESMLEKKDKIINIHNQQLNDLQEKLTAESEKATTAEKLLEEHKATQEAAEPEVSETEQVAPEVEAEAEEIQAPVVEPLPEIEETTLAEQTVLEPKLEPLPDWDSLPEIEVPAEQATEEEEPAIAQATPEETPEETKQPEPEQPEVQQPQQPVEVAEAADSGIMATVSGALGPVKEHWTKLAAGLGAIAILGGLVSMRRRKSAERLQSVGMGMPEALDDDEFDDILDETIVTPNEAEDQAGDVVFKDSGVEGAESEADVTEPGKAVGSETPDDVIEEADVYISYGLHQQAIDLLNDAITKEPDRKDYVVKMAEVYYSQKDQNGFEEYANTAKEKLGESSSEWQSIMAMGKELVPSSTLFGGAAAVGVAAQAAAEKPESADIDVGMSTGTHEAVDEMVAAAGNDATEDLDEGLDFNVDDEVNFEDDPVASKIMEANETSDILNFEVDDFADDLADEIEEDTAIQEDTDADQLASGIHEATGIHDTNISELTEELDDVGMQTTMDDLEPLDMGEMEADDTITHPVEDELDTGLDTGMDTLGTPEDPDATAAYIPKSQEEDTEQFDAGQIDTEFLDPAEATIAQTAHDLDELGPPSLIEEVGTKLDLAKAFVDMGDSDAAKETLLEVINEGDESQIKAAKDLMDKLGG